MRLRERPLALFQSEHPLEVETGAMEGCKFQGAETEDLNLGSLVLDEQVYSWWYTEDTLSSVVSGVESPAGLGKGQAGRH